MIEIYTTFESNIKLYGWTYFRDQENCMAHYIIGFGDRSSALCSHDQSYEPPEETPKIIAICQDCLLIAKEIIDSMKR